MTESKIITGPEMLARLRKILGAEPDAVRQCVYVINGECHCVAARALADHIPIETMIEWDGRDEIGNTIESMRRDLPLDGAAWELLVHAQKVQDGTAGDDTRWGAVLGSVNRLAATLLLSGEPTA